jgi:hypothetical protein
MKIFDNKYLDKIDKLKHKLTGKTVQNSTTSVNWNYRKIGKYSFFMISSTFLGYHLYKTYKQSKIANEK